MYNNIGRNDTNLSIIIPTYNRREQLEILLGQLKEQKFNNAQLEIIVVIDGSSDGTIEMLKTNFSNVHIVYGDGTWWYTRSMNEGFKYALEHIPTDLVLTMNDDIKIYPEYLNSILNAYYKVDENCIIGSVSFTQSKPYKIISSNSVIRNRCLLKMKHYLPIFSQVEPEDIKDRFLETDMLTGRGMLIPIEVLNALNLFDEKFKQYHSDGDFCLRAKINGYPVYVSFDAHIYVNEKSTGNGSSFLKEPFLQYLSNFWIPTSRLFIVDRYRFAWRHGCKLILPFNMLLFLTISMKNYFFKKKLQ